MPKYGGDYLSELSDDTFQAMIYELLRSEPNILVSRLDYNRPTCKKDHPPLDYPQDITGRGLFLFTRARGVNNVWHELTDAGKVSNSHQQSALPISIYLIKSSSRNLFLLKQPESVHQYSTSNSHLTWRLLGFAAASVYQLPNRSPLLLQHVISVLVFSPP